MMIRAGVYRKPVCFLLPDNHVLEESFLEDLNNLLNTGEIPNLYTKDDIDFLEKELNEEIRKRKFDLENPMLWYTENVRSHLHLCLAFSPVGEALRVRMRLFPSLVNCCTIDWLNPWPNEALLSVAKIFLKEIKI